MYIPAALSGPLRPLRLLHVDRRNRLFWLSRLFEVLGDWIYLVALLVLVYRLTQEVAVVATVMLLRLLPRPAIITCCDWFTSRFGLSSLVQLNLVRVPLVASLALIETGDDLWWAGPIVFVLGALGALSDTTRVTALPEVVPRRLLGGANALNGGIERVCFVAGPMLGALMLAVWGARSAFVAGALALLVAALVLWLHQRGPAIPSRHESPMTRMGMPRTEARSGRVSIGAIEGRHAALRVMIAGSFAAAVVAISLKVALVALVVDSLERSEAMFGILLALVGLGTLAGPVSVPRLLGRLPVSFFVTGSVVALAVGVTIISRTTSLALVAVGLFIIGVLSITNDMVTAAATRRLTSEDQLADVVRIMPVAITSGQIVALASMAVLSSRWSVTTAVMALSIGVATVMALLFVLWDGRLLLAKR